MIAKRVTITEHGDPAVTVTVIGTHDIARLLYVCAHGPIQWIELAGRIRRSLTPQHRADVDQQLGIDTVEQVSAS